MRGEHYRQPSRSGFRYPAMEQSQTRRPNRRMAYELKEAYSGAQASLYFCLWNISWGAFDTWLLAFVTRINDE